MANINRDIYGHLTREQSAVVAATPPVTLRFAHAGFSSGTKTIEPNNFFFKHFLLPARSGKTMDQKNDARLAKRQSDHKEPAKKFESASAKGAKWTDKAIRFGDWPTLDQSLSAQEKRKLDNAKTRNGLSWADKYGTIVNVPMNTVIVVNSAEGRDWATGGSATAIDFDTAALRFVNALQTALAGRTSAEPIHLDGVTVDFGVACVLESANTTPKSKMKIAAWACNGDIFDVYHSDGAA